MSDVVGPVQSPQLEDADLKTSEPQTKNSTTASSQNLGASGISSSENPEQKSDVVKFEDKDARADVSSTKVEGQQDSSSQGIVPMETEASDMAPERQSSNAADGSYQSIRSAAEERAINNVVATAMAEAFNPRSSDALRSAADGVLKIISEATGKSKSALMLPHLEQKAVPPLNKRRLLPLRHVPQQTGYAASLTYALQQNPPLLPLTQDVVGLISDAFRICEQENAFLVQSMTSSARQPAMDALPAMRSQCLALCCAALSWQDFRRAPSVTPPEVKPDIKEEAAKEAGKDAKEERSSSLQDYMDSGELGKLRHNIIQLLFKQLTSTDKFAVKQAQEGLEVVMSRQKISKPLLQISCRPVLSSLSHYNKLKVHMLQGLARLLRLLHGWFNAALGEKLIDHLKKWLEPEKLLVANKLWENSQDSEIAIAILELFHLLPSQAAKYLETSQERPGLVVLTIELEKALSQTGGNMQLTKTWSPYRDPLAKFLNKYSRESVDYFLGTQRMATPTYFWHFLDIIRSKIGQPLLEGLALAPDKFVTLLTAEPDPSPKVHQIQMDAQFNAVHLLAAVVKLKPDWLPANIFEILYQRWNSPARWTRTTEDENLPRQHTLENKWLAKCLLNYISRQKDRIDALFSLLTIFTFKTQISFHFLKSYLADRVAEEYSVDEQKKVLMYFLDAYSSSDRQRLPEDVLIIAARLLIRPMLAKGFERNASIVDNSILEIMMRRLFDSPEQPNAFGDKMHVEVLEISSLLIEHDTKQMHPHRTEVMKFGWSKIKREETKPYAFRNVACFLKHFEAPQRIGMQLFFSLLRDKTHHDPRRSQVKQALDIIPPVLARYKSKGRTPDWLPYIKKWWLEEGSNLPLMIHFWQLVVRHSDVFYPCRAVFSQQIVKLLMKLGLGHQNSLENRRLAIDMAAQLVEWEKRTLEGPPDRDAGKRTREEAGLQGEEDHAGKQARSEATSEAMDVPETSGDVPDNLLGMPAQPPSRQASMSSLQGPGSAGLSGSVGSGRAADAPEFRLPFQMQEVVVGFIIRMAFLLGDAIKDPEFLLMFNHLKTVLKGALVVWPNAPVKLLYIEKLIVPKMQQNPDNPPPSVTVAVEVLDLILSAQPEALLRNSGEQVNLIVDACFKIRQQNLVDQLAAAMKKVYVLFSPASADNPVKAVQDRLHQMINDHLHGAGTSSAISPGAFLPGVCTALTLIKAIEEVVPGFMLNNFLPHMVRLLGRLAGENSNIQGLLLARKEEPALRGLQKAQRPTAADPEYSSAAWAVREILDLTRQFVTSLGDQKRSYIQSLWLLASHPAATLIDPSILMAILGSVELWILDPRIAQAAVSDKDALHILQRFAALQHDKLIPKPLHTAFELKLLGLLHKVCSQSGPYGAQFQTEVFEKVERPYMLGLRSSSQDMRRQFFQIYNKTIPTPLFDRLHFLVCTQSWEKLAGTFWLKEALDILMAGIEGSGPIRLGSNSAQIPILLAKTKPQTFDRAQQEAMKSQSGVNPAASQAAAANLPASGSHNLQMHRPQVPGAAARPQMHFGPGQHNYPPHQGFQYPQMQQSPYLGLQQTGLAPGQGQNSSPYPQNLQLQRPGLYHQTQNMGAMAQQNPLGGMTPSQAGGNASGAWPPLQQQAAGVLTSAAGSQQQGSAAAGMAQLAVSQGMALNMQGMFLRPPQSPLPQGGMLHSFPMNSQSPRPGALQQPGFPGTRPAGLLQLLKTAKQKVQAVKPILVQGSHTQQSVAQQLLSQQPITSHSMQGGQPVMSQPQFMAGAAQMASRPLSMLGNPAVGIQPRSTTQGSGSQQLGLAPASGPQSLNPVPGQTAGPQAMPMPASSAMPNFQSQQQGGPARPQNHPGMFLPNSNGMNPNGNLQPNPQQNPVGQQQAGRPQQLGSLATHASAPQPGSVNMQMPNMQAQYTGLQTLPQQQLSAGQHPGMQGLSRGQIMGLANSGVPGSDARPASHLQSLTAAMAHPQPAGGSTRPGTLPRIPSGAALYGSGMHRNPSSNIFAQHLQNQAMQGLGSMLQAPGATRTLPEQELIEDDGLGEREVFKDLKLAPHIDSMMHEHGKFLAEHGSYKVRQLLESLSEVMLHEDEMAYHFWVLMFPVVWGSLSDNKDNQIFLAKPIITLLSQEYHQQQGHKRPNVIPALVEAISMSQPQPKIPSELIKYLGKAFNAWHIALPLLESHSMLFPQDSRYFNSLAELYSELNEEDVLCGLWKRRCIAPETRAAVGWMQHGYLDVAQDCILQAMSKHANKTYDNEQIKIGRNEQIMWQRTYIECCAQLGQWKTLEDLGKHVDDFNLLANVYSKSLMWRELKENILPYALLEDNAATHSLHACVMLQELHLNEAEGQTDLAVEKSLQKCWSMPPLGFWPHVPLLAQFQKIVELHESRRLLLDLVRANHRADHDYKELKDIMETWRLRTPNEWDSFGVWSDVLIWRNQIYNVVIEAFKAYSELAPQLFQLGYRDKAWSVNRLGRIARKHECPETAKLVITSMYGHDAMEVQEAFTKIREQAKTFLLQPELHSCGLNLLNSQNLNYFQSHYQAEIFRLKGVFLQSLGQPEPANEAFSTSLTLCSQLPTGWLSWGSFCDQRYASTRDSSWLESAVTAYLQAIRQGSSPARSLIPRILMLLSFDNESRVVGQTVERGLRQVPHWVWLAWIPQLLTGLQRPEAYYCKRILQELSRLFPQAVYYGLRVNVLVLREAAQKAVAEKRAMEAKAAQAASRESPSNPPQQTPEVKAEPPQGTAAIPQMPTPTTGNTQESTTQPGQASTGTAASAEAQAQRPKVPLSRLEKAPELVAFEAGREVMDVLRAAHSHMCNVLEVVSADLGTKFGTKPLERLLGVVTALLHRAYKLPYSNAAQTPPSLKKELAAICRHCFMDDGRIKQATTILQYKEQFLKALNPDDNPDFPPKLGDLAARLKAWRNTLQQAVDEAIDPILKLEDETRGLMEISFTDVEMPGQYALGNEVSPDGIVHLESISPDVVVVRRHGVSHRRLAFYGSDGRTRYYSIHGSISWLLVVGDEKQVQLLGMMNRLLDRHPKARQRCLAWSTPVVIPLWPNVRLVEEDPSHFTYGESYDIHCARHGREGDLPIVKFKQLCCTENGHLLNDPAGSRREAAYQEVAKHYVHDSLFSSYIHKVQPDCNHLWIFKKQLCISLALSGLLSHMLLVGSRSPNKLLIAKSSGKIHQLEFYPNYNSQCLLERNESVPFRLTRNLTSLFTPYGVEGWFVSTLTAAAEGILGRNNNLADLLGLHFRDDIPTFMTRKSGRTCIAGLPVTSAQLQEMVHLNVERALERMREVIPPLTQDNLAADPQRGAHELVAQATDSRNLCKLDPTWHPWF